MKMKVYRDEACWQRFVYTVEAESAEQAMEKVKDGIYDSVDLRDGFLAATNLEHQFHEVVDESNKTLWHEDSN